MSKGGKKPLYIGIDLGGTKVEATILNGQGEIHDSHRYSTNPETGPEDIISKLIETVIGLQEKNGKNALSLGVGVAGQIDSSGTIISAPNLPFKNEPLQDRLERELNIPVLVTNDVRAATYGEWIYGAGIGVDDLLVLFVGTGIGGGVVSGGRLLNGCTNTFGELGHITIVADGKKCRCPNWGCLEAYAGGWGIAENAQQAVNDNPMDGDTIITIAGGIEDISAGTVSEAYRDGDHLARKIVEETAEYLGSGLTGLVNAFNPCKLILGGGVIEGIPDLITMAEEIIKENALKSNRDKLSISRAVLGNKAGVIGAGGLAMNKLEPPK